MPSETLKPNARLTLTAVNHRMGTNTSITNDVSAAHNLLLSKCSRARYCRDYEQKQNQHHSQTTLMPQDVDQWILLLGETPRHEISDAPEEPFRSSLRCKGIESKVKQKQLNLRERISVKCDGCRSFRKCKQRPSSSSSAQDQNCSIFNQSCSVLPVTARPGEAVQMCWDSEADSSCEDYFNCGITSN